MVGIITIPLGNLPVNVYHSIVEWFKDNDIEIKELEVVDDTYIASIGISEEDAIILRLRLGI